MVVETNNAQSQAVSNEFLAFFLELLRSFCLLFAYSCFETPHAYSNWIYAWISRGTDAAIYMSCIVLSFAVHFFDIFFSSENKQQILQCHFGWYAELFSYNSAI